MYLNIVFYHKPILMYVWPCIIYENYERYQLDTKNYDLLS